MTSIKCAKNALTINVIYNRQSHRSIPYTKVRLSGFGQPLCYINNMESISNQCAVSQSISSL